MAKFGAMLRQERKKAGKTLDDVARALDCTVSYLSDVELSRRKAFPTAKILDLASILGCDVQPLIAAAAKERGGVLVNSTNPQVNNIAAGLARSGERLSPAKLAKIEQLLEEDE
jgi:transcriptional regulator with XRE-family HTH domain